MKAGWRTVPMGELCTIKNGKSDTQDAVDDGEFAFFDRSKKIKRSSQYLFDCEALIIPGEGTEFLPRHFSGKFDLHQRAYALFEPIDKLDIKYLYHYLHYRSDYFPTVAVGATVKSLRMRHFEQLPVQLTNIQDQQRIVSILDEAIEGIATATANAEKNLGNARKIFECYLQLMFITSGEAWEKHTLKDVAITFGRGKSRHRPRNEPKLYGGDYPFIQTGDIRNSDHFITEYSQTYNEVGLAQSKLWSKGTLCITIAANIAETGILGFDSCFPDSVIGFVADPQKSDVHFVEYLLGSFKAILKAKGKGSAQDNLNLASFENEKFPFPPLEQQKSIVATLDELSAEVSKLESVYQQKLDALAELKKSILHQAFTGQLR